MLRHAYLIIAHTNPAQLKKLIHLLDDERNDVYVLIDKKSKFECNFTDSCKESKLYVLPQIAISWGGVSQIEAELSLFEMASRNGPYQYYHLLSGMDLPLHNQNYIHAFFDKYNGYEFFTFVGDEIYKRVNPSKRIRFYYPFQNMNANRYVRGVLMKFQNKILVPIQKLFRVNRIKQYNDKIGYGSNWVSVTDDFVKYMLERKIAILKHYRSSMCCDEIYKHTLLVNSSFSDRLFCSEGVHDRPEDRQGNLRYINWWDGHPKTWRIGDKSELESIIKRGYLFSRKFDEREDSEIIDWLYGEVENESYQKLLGDFVE